MSTPLYTFMVWTGTILLLLSFVTYVKFKYQEYEATVSFVIVRHTIRPPSSYHASEITHNDVWQKNTFCQMKTLTFF